MTFKDKLKLLKVEADNFRSLSNFSLGFPEGLTVIHGKNGSGKSSIILAILYALYGRVGKYTKSDLLSYESEVSYPKISVEFRYQDKDIKFTRGRQVSFSVGGERKVVRDHPLYRNFLYNINYSFITPDTLLFIDMSPSERREVLINLIDDLSLIKKETIPYINNIVLNFSNKISSYENDYNRIIGKIDGLRSNINTYRALAERNRDLLSKLKERIEELEEQKKVLETKLKEYGENYLEDLKKEREKLNTQLKLVVDEIKNLKEKIKNINSLINLVSALKAKKSELILARQNIEQSVKAKSCYWCGSKLSAENISSIVDRQDEIEKELYKINKDIYNKINIISDKELVESKLEELQNKYVELSNRKKSLEYDLSAYSDLVSSYKKVSEDLKNKQASYDSLVCRIKEEPSIEDLKKELKELEKQAKIIDRKIKIFKSKKGKFDNILLFLKRDIVDIYVSRLCEVLEASANSLLDTFGLSVSIVPNKGKIDINVGDRKFYQLSSGERQRIRIAVTLAFTSFANNSDFVFIDEVFDSNLDSDGLEFLAHCIGVKMKERFKQVILVSHRDDFISLLGNYNLIELIKENGRTKILQN